MPNRRDEWDEGSDIVLRVVGIPGSQGSKTLMKGHMVEGSSATGRKVLKEWRTDVRDAALTWRGDERWILIDEPIQFNVRFLFPRPASHTKAKRTIPWHWNKPDNSKLLRSTEDALTHVIWRDDAIIAKHIIEKRYADEGQLTGAQIRIKNLRGIT